VSQPSWDELRYHILQVLKEYKSEFDKNDEKFKAIEDTIRRLEEQNINQKWINRLILLGGSMGGGVSGSAVFSLIKEILG
jgi:hypothetical protein